MERQRDAHVHELLGVVHVRYRSPVRAVADPWEEAGATWTLADFGPQPRERDVRVTIEAGPR
jgi:hypothetical protein